MELISTAKTTNLVSFDTLKSKFTYHHVENDSRDFSLIGNKNVFFEVNRTSGLEMLRLKASTKNENEISLVRKAKVDNLHCIGCPKQPSESVALGLATGQIGLINYRTIEYISRFNADGSNNGVVFLDFNSTDDYLSAVYENGLINLYGLKTQAKVESLNIDENSTLARFHPTKRFHLSIASYTGAICIYDMQSKKNVFKPTDFHSAPCRDLCISSGSPDILLSVGYDCMLNVYDTRRKLPSHQIRSNHPLSSVGISECGRYCVTGNLKGELTSYDLRNLKDRLKCNKVYDTAVVRVGFASNRDGSANISELESPVLTETQNLPAVEEKNAKAIVVVDETQNKPRRDSFLDFINSQSFTGRVTNIRRDSFNIQALERRNGDLDPRISVGMRSSMDARLSMELKCINENLSDLSNGQQISSNVANKFKMRRSSIECVISEKKPKGKLIEDLMEEEVFDDFSSPKSQADASASYTNTQVIVLDESSKENILNDSRKDINFLMKLPDHKNSTPTIKRNSQLENKTNENSMNGFEMKTVLDEIKHLRSEMNTFKEEINDKFRTLEMETKWHIDINRGHLSMSNFGLWKDQMQVCEEIRSLLLGLMHSDSFVQDYIRLQSENDELKEKLNRLGN